MKILADARTDYSSNLKADNR